MKAACRMYFVGYIHRRVKSTCLSRNKTSRLLGTSITELEMIAARKTLSLMIAALVSNLMPFGMPVTAKALLSIPLTGFPSLFFRSRFITSFALLRGSGLAAGAKRGERIQANAARLQTYRVRAVTMDCRSQPMPTMHLPTSIRKDLDRSITRPTRTLVRGLAASKLVLPSVCILGPLSVGAHP